jgi:serine-type D-Ala-D-Ala carboxypeptidase
MVYKNPLHSRAMKGVAVAMAVAIPGAAIGLARAGAPEPGAILAPAAALAPALPTLPEIVAEQALAPVRIPEIKVDAAAARLNMASLRDAERAVRAEIARGAFPGAALAAGRAGQVAYLTGIGTLQRGGAGVDAETTLYDIASLSKVVGTTTAVMLLVEDGALELDAPVHKYLPAFRGDGKDAVTIRHLLTHTSGLPAGASAPGDTPEQRLARLVATPLKGSPGKQVEYSDVGFVVLWAAAERAAGEPLPDLLHRRVFAPLGMASTTFNPGEGCVNCPPTRKMPDGTLLRGVVHDPTARRLGGVAGHAGLFSTAADLARFAAMMAGEGELDAVRVLKTETVHAFTRRAPGARFRALGWETRDDTGIGGAGLALSQRAYGHTGFTGTSMWIDPDRGSWSVLLTNRTLDPRGPNRIQALRRTVNASVAVAADRE